MGASVAGIGETRDRIFDTAAKMLRTRSYLGFSFGDIAREVGVRRESLHHHFASKEVLGLALIADASQRFEVWCASAPVVPDAALNAFVAMYRNALSAGQAVCPGGSFGPGWDCTEDSLKTVVQELRAKQIDWLTNVFMAQDATRSRPTAAGLAASVFATCQGALLSARVTGKVEDFDTALTIVRALTKGAV